MNTAKSIKFLPIQGNKIFKQNDEIKIKIDAGSAPLINTANSYLIFSLKFPNMPAYYNPSKYLAGARIFREITIMDGNEQLQLENLTDLHLLETIHSYYGENDNDRNLRGIFEGRCDDVAFPFAENDDHTEPTNNQRGGGINSPYYEPIPADGGTIDLARKTQVMYRFPLSGILNPLRTENWPNILTQGLVIRLRLLDANTLVVPRTIKQVVGGVFDGCGLGELMPPGQLAIQDAGTVEAGAVGKRQRTGIVGGDANGYDDKRVYSIDGFVNTDAATLAIGNIAAATNFRGVVLQSVADAGNKLGCDSVANCLFKVGGRVRFAVHGAQDADNQFGSRDGVDARISEIKIIATKVCVMFDANQQTGDQHTQGSGIVPDLNDNDLNFEVSDIQYCAEVVNAEPGYIQELASRFSSGKSIIQYRTYDDYKINIPRGSTINELYIPADNTRAFSILNYNQDLVEASPVVESCTPPNHLIHTGAAGAAVVDGIQASEYQFNINGNLVPQLPVSLKDVSRDADVKGVSVLHQIELEKALMATSIPIKNLLHPGKMLVIGRGLGRDGSTFNLAQNSMRLRVNYQHQLKNILTHNVVYSVRVLRTVNGARVVVR